MSRTITDVATRHIGRFPAALIVIISGMIVTTGWFSLKPLYDVALERQLHRAVEVRQSVQAMLDEYSYRVSNVLELAQYDNRVFAAIQNAQKKGDDESFAGLRELLQNYRKGGRLTFLEVVGLDKKVLLSSGLQDRFEVDVGQWDVIKNTTATHPVSGLTVINDKMYLVSSMGIFNETEGNLGVFVGGVELDSVFADTASRSLGAQLSFHHNGHLVASTFAGNVDMSAVQGTQAATVQLVNKERFAMSVLPLKSVGGAPIGTVAVGASMKDFDDSVRYSIVEQVQTLVLPFLFTIVALVFMGRTIVQAFAALKRLKNRLETILIATKDMALLHEKADAVLLAAGYIRQRIAFASGSRVQLYLLEGERWWVSVLLGGEEGIDDIAQETTFPADDAFATLRSDTAVPVLREGNLYVPVVYARKLLAVLVFEGYPCAQVQAEDVHFIETMSASLAAALENITFLMSAQEKAKADAELEAELRAAQAVQEALLPPAINFPGVEIRTFYQAAAQTGGDWYGYHYDKASHSLFVCVGDVTGHGFPSALITGVVCGAVYAGEFRADLCGAFTESVEQRLLDMANVVSRVVAHTCHQNKFMTMCFLALSLDTGEVHYLNASHTHLLVRPAAGGVKVIANMGSRLGCIDPSFEVRKFQVQPDDVLFVYTDGLVENMGPDGKSLPARSLKAIVAEEGDLAKLQERILTSGRAIWKETAPQDDVTLFALKWKGPTTREEFSKIYEEVPHAGHPADVAMSFPA